MSLNTFPGQELRDRREALGLTADDVFRKTRIPSQYLLAIEDAKFRALPAASYTLGFLKSYCEFLELDSRRFVDSFRACVRPSASRFLGMRRNQAKPIPLWAGEAVAWCAICAIVALCWLAYSEVFRPQTNPLQGRVQASTFDLGRPAGPISGGQ